MTRHSLSQMTSTSSSSTGPSPTRVIDMRSDTVTHPTPSMKAAMVAAPLGDDVYQDDPTVNAFEQRMAFLCGKEAALFVPSGTQGNLIAVLTHCCKRGEEVIMGDQAHIAYYEQGGCATLGGVHPRQIPTQPDGTLLLSDLEHAIRPGPPYDVHYPISRLICLEQTHNRMGGKVLSKDYIDSVGRLAHQHGLALHVDGARIFNAVVQSKVSLKDMLEHVDSVSICFSKGLATPVGSCVVGSKTFICDCRRLRKALGGGLRQAGMLVAAMNVALDEMINRLSDDHSNAQILAKGLAEIDGLEVDAHGCDTNIVFVTLNESFPVNSQDLLTLLAERNVRIGKTSANKVRFVTHYMITAADIEYTIGQCRLIAKECQKKQN